MPVASPEIYRKMLKKAKENKFAFPAINVTSMETARAALLGFSERKSDGIIQVSTGGASYASGTKVNQMVLGAVAIAEYVHLLAKEFDIYVALHTDHCHPEKLDSFIRPLIEKTRERRAKKLGNLFNSHMFDGSALPLEKNLEISLELVKEMQALDLILEVEAGVVGGEEDGHDTSGVENSKLYTTPEEMLRVYEVLSQVTKDFLFAATFGNVHGVYKPGHVKLKPSILKDGQKAVLKKFGSELYLVFHGGSGSSLKEIRETLDYGVIKMNIDTDNQYIYTESLVRYFSGNLFEILRINGETGNKKKYDPRVYGRIAEKAMAARVSLSCDQLRSTGHSIF